MDCVRYAAYGSNVNPARFAKHLRAQVSDPDFPEQGWFVGEGGIYFAGTSETWGAGVAFVDLQMGSLVIYRTYHLGWQRFLDVWSSENHKAPTPYPQSLLNALWQAPKGAEFTIPTPGKYDTATVIVPGECPMVYADHIQEAFLRVAQQAVLGNHLGRIGRRAPR